VTEPRYVTPGWPSGVNGHAALMPHFNRTAGSGWEQYKDGVSGHPGTLPIPVTGPQVENSKTAMQNMGRSRSSDAPGFFLPNLYYARPQRDFWPGAGQPVAVASDSLMPVPATDPRGVPARMAVAPVLRGRANLAQPANPVAWPRRG